MKILLAVTSHLSAVLVRGQGKSLSAKGHTVIFSSSKGDAQKKLVMEEKLLYEEVDFVRDISLKNDVVSLYQCIKILKRHKPDVVNAGTPKAGFIYMLAAFICNIKVRIFTLRGIRSSSLSGYKKSVVWFMEWMSCLLSHRVIAISPSLKEEAIRLKLVNKTRKVKVIGKGSSNGVDLNMFSDKSILKDDLKKIKSKYGIDGFVFGFIGRLVKDKGVEELIEAFIKVKRNSRRNIYLMLVGEFEVDNCISQNTINLINSDDSIICVGHTDNVPLFASLIDVLILPSYREGFGNVVIESAAMGTPAIVTDIPGARDTIVDGVTGFLMKPKCVEDLETLMIRYLLDFSLKDIQGESAKTRVKKFFDREVIWREQEALYVDIYKKKMK